MAGQTSAGRTALAYQLDLDALVVELLPGLQADERRAADRLAVLKPQSHTPAVHTPKRPGTYDGATHPPPVESNAPPESPASRTHRSDTIARSTPQREQRGYERDTSLTRLLWYSHAPAAAASERRQQTEVDAQLRHREEALVCERADGEGLVELAQRVEHARVDPHRPPLQQVVRRGGRDEAAAEQGLVEPGGLAVALHAGQDLRLQQAQLAAVVLGDAGPDVGQQPAQALLGRQEAAHVQAQKRNLGAQVRRRDGAAAEVALHAAQPVNLRVGRGRDLVVRRAGVLRLAAPGEVGVQEALQQRHEQRGHGRVPALGEGLDARDPAVGLLLEGRRGAQPVLGPGLVAEGLGAVVVDHVEREHEAERAQKGHRRDEEPVGDRLGHQRGHLQADGAVAVLHPLVGGVGDVQLGGALDAHQQHQVQLHLVDARGPDGAPQRLPGEALQGALRRPEDQLKRAGVGEGAAEAGGRDQHVQARRQVAAHGLVEVLLEVAHRLGPAGEDRVEGHGEGVHGDDGRGALVRVALLAFAPLADQVLVPDGPRDAGGRGAPPEGAQRHGHGQPAGQAGVVALDAALAARVRQVVLVGQDGAVGEVDPGLAAQRVDGERLQDVLRGGGHAVLRIVPVRHLARISLGLHLHVRLALSVKHAALAGVLVGLGALVGLGIVVGEHLVAIGELGEGAQPPRQAQLRARVALGVAAVLPEGVGPAEVGGAIEGPHPRRGVLGAHEVVAVDVVVEAGAVDVAHAGQVGVGEVQQAGGIVGDGRGERVDLGVAELEVGGAEKQQRLGRSGARFGVGFHVCVAGCRRGGVRGAHVLPRKLLNGLPGLARQLREDLGGEVGNEHGLDVGQARHVSEGGKRVAAEGRVVLAGAVPQLLDQGKAEVPPALQRLEQGQVEHQVNVGPLVEAGRQGDEHGRLDDLVEQGEAVGPGPDAGGRGGVGAVKVHDVLHHLGGAVAAAQHGLEAVQLQEALVVVDDRVGPRDGHAVAGGGDGRRPLEDGVVADAVGEDVVRNPVYEQDHAVQLGEGGPREAGVATVDGGLHRHVLAPGLAQPRRLPVAAVVGHERELVQEAVVPVEHGDHAAERLAARAPAVQIAPRLGEGGLGAVEDLVEAVLQPGGGLALEGGVIRLLHELPALHRDVAAHGHHPGLLGVGHVRAGAAGADQLQVVHVVQAGGLGVGLPGLLHEGAADQALEARHAAGLVAVRDGDPRHDLAEEHLALLPQRVPVVQAVQRLPKVEHGVLAVDGDAEGQERQQQRRVEAANRRRLGKLGALGGELEGKPVRL
ncbi:uncharacterized protein BcabD6B2_07340 [Babesia caballi]|uniref:Uncharacterized protein n=1 Tax=Babesia caballi TaxID=5871 RepID=A0AAV4LMU2_BABCB|nr:hypothetical protein BcabD6B2_07340 [Babesia caballi]